MAYELSDTRQVIERSLFEALRSIAVSSGYLADMNTKVNQNITALNNPLKKFTIAGNHTELYISPRNFNIVDSTGNDGEYTVVSSIYTGGNTIITVAETIPHTTVDGKASIYKYYDDNMGVASFAKAQKDIISQRGFVVEVFGVGSTRAKYQKKVPRIVLIPNQSLPGALGGAPDPIYTANGDPLSPSSYTKHVTPPQTVDMTHDVHIVTSTAEESRICHGIVALALPKRGYIPLYNNADERFFVESFSYRNIPNPADGITEDVYMYKSSDMYETTNDVSPESLTPINEINIDRDIS